MTLPGEYDPVALQQEITRLRADIDKLVSFINISATPGAPLNPRNGWLAVSDGTGSGFDAVSGAGLYRYLDPNWVFIG
jgi:hypothetical protein